LAAEGREEVREPGGVAELAGVESVERALPALQSDFGARHFGLELLVDSLRGELGTELDELVALRGQQVALQLRGALGAAALERRVGAKRGEGEADDAERLHHGAR